MTHRLSKKVSLSMFGKGVKVLAQATKVNKVDMFVPIDLESSIQKTNEQDESDKSWYVEGYATTPDLDIQDDIVDPKGIDISYFKKYGFINYEHQQGEEYIIGAPVEGTYVDDTGLVVKAKLYKGNPYAKGMWTLAKNIAESGVDRKLGFSIEGIVKERDIEDPRIISKTYITNVALTTSPANPNATWEAFMKSFLTGYGVTPEEQTGASALRTESFARSLHNLSYAYQSIGKPQEFDKVWKEIGSYLDAMDKYSPEAAVMFVQLFKGYSRKEAIEVIDEIVNEGPNQINS